MYNYTGYGMNPYQQQLTQNRIAQMEQQYNYQQPYMQNQSQTQMLKGRPVSSFYGWYEPLKCTYSGLYK